MVTVTGVYDLLLRIARDAFHGVLDMAGYDKYDLRLESLVVETRTYFDPEIEEEIRQLDIDDGESEAADGESDTHALLAEAAHRSPEQATSIHYERSHTGFTREITITPEDLERIFYSLQSDGS